MKKWFCILFILLIIIYFINGIGTIESSVIRLEKALKSYDTKLLDNIILNDASIKIEISDIYYDSNYCKIKNDLISDLKKEDIKITFALLNSKVSYGLFKNVVEGAAFIHGRGFTGEKTFKIEFLNLPLSNKVNSIIIK